MTRQLSQELQETPGWFSRLGDVLPFLNWFSDYKRKDFVGDLIAGITVATMLVPQSMAYALLAGVSPIVGLYASILPVLIYGLMGSSGVLTLGPTAITSVMVLSSLGALETPGTPEYLVLTITLAFALGIVFLLMGLLRVGFIVNLLSRPVLAGYVNAAAVIIILSQIKNLLGLDLERTSRAHELLLGPLQNLGQTNWVTLVIGATCLGLLLFFRSMLGNLLKRLRLNDVVVFVITRSGPLVVVMGSTLLVYSLNLIDRANVQTIGAVPSGLPQLGVPAFNLEHMPSIVFGAVAIAFVGFMEGISTAKTLTGKDRQDRRRVRPNQEMIAMGVSNIASSISGGLPVTTSISRSAVNYTAGAQTGLSSVIAAGVVALAVTVLAPLFQWLPQAALAAIIVMSVVNLVDPQAVSRFRKYSKGEPIPFLVTFLGTFLFSIEVGIAGGIAASAAIHLYRTTRPGISAVGRIPGTNEYKPSRYYDTEIIPEVLVMRIDESLYFANAEYLDQVIRESIDIRPQVEHLVLSCNAVNTIDASAIHILEELIEDIEESGIRVYIAGIKDRVKVRLDRVDFSERMGEDRFYSTTHDAVIATGHIIDDLLPI
jgi:SulP family sulfate permease